MPLPPGLHLWSQAQACKRQPCRIELQFPDAIYVRAVESYETFKTGAIVRILTTETWLEGDR